MKETLMFAACTAALLTGCALGLHTGEHYEMTAPGATPYDNAIARCTDQMRTAAIAGDSENRKNFSRGCMLHEGWTAVSSDGTRLLPPPEPRQAPHWQHADSTQELNVAMAKCRMGMAMLPSPTPTGGGLVGLGNAITDLEIRNSYMNDCMVAQGWQFK